ncbi:MAG: glucuronate isomerase [Chthoniobacterales bacterium]
MIRPFLDKDFFLLTESARRLYHGSAALQPIIDYHSHLSARAIAEDHRFSDLTSAWLDGDHYKWRAMRAKGIEERFLTGDATPFEKFEKWAETVPFTIRNPLYHWTHLELRRYFGIHDLLTPRTARSIYDRASFFLNTPEFSTRGLLRKMNVELVCTTDDPADDLEHHRVIRDGDCGIKVLPTFRLDRYYHVGAENFASAVEQLSERAGWAIASFDDLLDALKNRADFFHSFGGRLADCSMERIPDGVIDPDAASRTFKSRMEGAPVDPIDAEIYQATLLDCLGRVYHRRGWTQQFHLGVIRGTNSRRLRELGPDMGFDTIGDLPQARPLAQFLDRLDTDDQLPRTILYNLNPANNEVFAAMIGNFQSGSVPGKIQYGSGWWFLDQRDGMERQLNALSNLGLLSRFVGMLTDSRSFLSFPRHEYFRRILCNLIGSEVERGELPNDLEWLGGIVADISYGNACRYFGFYDESQPAS